jgi:pyridoxal phosphate enzyme (YggS family)
MIETKEKILSNYQNVLDCIHKAAESVGRDPADVTLVVVTKQRSLEVIQTLIEIGVRHIGENRVEEALPKMKALPDQSGVQWHMIGHVQSRKAQQVCEHFNYFHALDRMKLALRLDRFSSEIDRILPVLLQFNVSGEGTKSGWLADDEREWNSLLPEIADILELKNLEVQGLMTMAPYSLNPEDSRPIFVRMAKLREFLAGQFPGVQWDQLSMGMSGDYEVGVQEGATFVRIGTAILGERIIQ